MTDWFVPVGPRPDGVDAVPPGDVVRLVVFPHAGGGPAAAGALAPLLPAWLQPLAWALPPTYVFEGMRALALEHVFRGDLMLQALGMNLVLCCIAVAAFLTLLQRAREAGSLLQTGE